MIPMREADPARGDAGAASFVYALLSRLWLTECDAALIELLERTDIREPFEDAGGVVPSRQQVETLAADYCQLFVGPKGHVAPYQSVWQSGQLQGDVTASTKRFADLVGYQLPESCPTTILDHLGVQLDIMAWTLRIDQASSEVSGELADEIAGEFFARHLAWPGPLLERATRRASTDFYRAVIGMTAQFLETERLLRKSPASR